MRTGGVNRAFHVRHTLSFGTSWHEPDFMQSVKYNKPVFLEYDSLMSRLIDHVLPNRDGNMMDLLFQQWLIRLMNTLIAQI